MRPLTVYELVILGVGIERLVELRRSRRQARALMSRGGVEYGASHYPPMVALHSAFLVGCALEPVVFARRLIPALALPMLALAIGAQALRWWSIATLGPHWSTRVVVLPGAPKVDRGPYRWLSHPNYVAVVIEGFALPMIHSAWLTALAFTSLDAVLLSVRIRVEERALRTMGPAR